jgi:tetratricopeptide (TPR) repeat protein
MFRFPWNRFVLFGLLSTCMVCAADAQGSPGLAHPSGRVVVSVHDLQIPDRARSAFNKGVKHLAVHDDASSIPQFQKAIKDFPDYFEAYAGLGSAEAHLQRWDDAEASFRKSVALSKGNYAPADFGLGMVLGTIRAHFTEAEASVRAGLEISPADVTGNFLLGWVLYSTNRLRDAEQVAQNIITLRPSFPGGFLLLAQVHISEKQYASVLDDLDRYESLGVSSPSDPAFQKNLINLRTQLEYALATAQPHLHSSSEPLAAVPQ